MTSAPQGIHCLLWEARVWKVATCTRATQVVGGPQAVGTPLVSSSLLWEPREGKEREAQCSGPRGGQGWRGF